MPSSLLYRRGARVACAVSAAVAAAAVSVPSSALASPQKPSTGLSIVRPYRSIVSGTVVFSVRGTASGVGRIVFAIDGRRVWSTHRLSPRYRRATMINTRKLRDGWHVLAVREFFAGRHRRVVRKTILVRNHLRAAVTRTSKQPSMFSVGAFGPPAGGIAGASVANLNRETYLYSTTWTLSQEANRYHVIVLAGDEHWLIPQLKAINPNVKILLYQSIMHTNRNDYASMQTVTGCTAYADDVANHPGWFLHDQSGNPILAPGTNDHYVMDVGNPAYQQACATNAAALAKQYGFDGIFWDVVMGRLDWAMTHGGMHVPAYPTNMLWQSAMNSALSVLGPALRAQGLLAFGNVSGTATVAMWEQWVSHLDGVEEESWTDGGPGVAQQIPFWSAKFSELSWAQANGKYEIVHSYNSTEAGNTYGLAAMMLVGNGGGSYSTSNTNYTSSENWFPEYATGQALGAPAGPYKILANGVYERAFSKGIVLVNPGGTSVPSFSLGGSVYSGSGLTNVRTAQLGATSGVILLKVG